MIARSRLPKKRKRGKTKSAQEPLSKPDGARWLVSAARAIRPTPDRIRSYYAVGQDLSRVVTNTGIEPVTLHGALRALCTAAGTNRRVHITVRLATIDRTRIGTDAEHSSSRSGPACVDSPTGDELEQVAPTARRHTPPDVAHDAAGSWLDHHSRARSSVQSLAPSMLASRRDSSRAV